MKQNHITFHYNGIKVDGKLVRCYYSLRDTGSVRISARDYKRLPAELFSVENNTDFYTDYFDNDRTVVTNAHPLFKYVAWACGKQEAHCGRVVSKHYRKLAENPAISDRMRTAYLEKADHYEQKAIEGDTMYGENPGQPTAEEIQWAQDFVSLHPLGMEA